MPSHSLMCMLFINMFILRRRLHYHIDWVVQVEYFVFNISSVNILMISSSKCKVCIVIFSVVVTLSPFCFKSFLFFLFRNQCKFIFPDFDLRRVMNLFVKPTEVELSILIVVTSGSCPILFKITWWFTAIVSSLKTPLVLPSAADEKTCLYPLHSVSIA